MALTEEELDMMINWDTSSLGLFEQQAMNNLDSSSSGQSGFQHHEPTAIQTPPLQTQIPGTSRAPPQASLTNLSGPIESLWGYDRALMLSITRSMIRTPRIHTRHVVTEADFEQPHETAMNNSDSSSSGQSGFQHHEPTAIQTPPLQTQIPPLETGTSLWGQDRALMLSITRSMIRGPRIHTRHVLTEADCAGFKEDKISKYLNIITHNNIDDEKTVCAICLDNFCGKDMQVAIVDGCGHKFHACCLKRWLRRKNICPLCRRIAIRFL